jgi:uncharacterized protein
VAQVTTLWPAASAPEGARIAHRKMNDQGSSMHNNDLRALHGGILLLVFPMPWFIPSILFWPSYLLLPLLLYFFVVLLIQPLRRSINWIQVGHIRSTASITLMLLAVSCVALVVYEHQFHPDLHDLIGRMPGWMLDNVWLGGIVFAGVNALLEEALFRGILLDALESQIGIVAAVLAQAFVFGMLHRQGYPPGLVGIVLATLFGLMLGWLRVKSRGLAAPLIVHIAADATIFGIVMN